MKKKTRKHIVLSLLLVSLVGLSLPGATTRASTITLSAAGWSDPSVGTWDLGTLTGTLTTDLNDSILITGDGITLDGNGHSITGGDSGVGVRSQFSNLTIENLTVRQFQDGIYVGPQSTNITVTGNTIELNKYGISLSATTNSTLANNTINSNSSYGIRLFDGSSNIEITGNTVSNSPSGVLLYWSSQITLTNNTASGNTIGLRLIGSIGDTVTGNTASENTYGITLTENSTDNEIYNNNFINNETQAFVENSIGNIFNLDVPVGGNYWSDYDTSEEECDDLDPDGFCDLPYVITVGQDQDNLPWTREDGWANQPPIANAGIDQSVHPGTLVDLDGSGSSDPDENYPLSYFWQITDKPTGSVAELSDPCDVNPSFTVDMLGDYVIELVVTDSLGAQSEPDSVLISTFNTPPVADAGPDQAIMELGTEVFLDGSASYDEEGDEITYLWAITQKPAESEAELSDPDSVTPSFVADVHGDYEISLVVTDIFGAASDPDTVGVNFENVPPVADAGDTQSVILGDTVFLNGSGSTDANFDLLSYSWSFVLVPEGSIAELSDPVSVQTSFVADEPGEYIVSLVVNDGFGGSDADNATVMAITSQEAASVTLRDAIEMINALDRENFKNKKLKKALSKKINKVLREVDKGKYEKALHKLEKDVLRKVNGCANIGEPDRNDWINNCDAQSQVYPLVTEAIEHLEDVIQ